MLMTSRRPKIIVSPSAIRITATPMESPLTICCANTYWSWSIRLPKFALFAAHHRKTRSLPRVHRDIRHAGRNGRGMPCRRASESLAGIRPDRLRSRHLADDLELATREFDRVHVLDRLVVAGAHLFHALRRHPFEIGHCRAQLVGIGAMRLFHRRLVEVQHAIRIGAVEVRWCLVCGLECSHEFPVFRRVDFRRVTYAGDAVSYTH